MIKKIKLKVDDEKNDVFAVGLIILGLFGCNIFGLNVDINQLNQRLIEVECKFGKSLREFLYMMLNYNQDKRKKFNDLSVFLRVNN